MKIEPTYDLIDSSTSECSIYDVCGAPINTNDDYQLNTDGQTNNDMADDTTIQTTTTNPDGTVNQTTGTSTDFLAMFGDNPIVDWVRVHPYYSLGIAAAILYLLFARK